MHADASTGPLAPAAPSRAAAFSVALILLILWRPPESHPGFAVLAYGAIGLAAGFGGPGRHGLRLLGGIAAVWAALSLIASTPSVAVPAALPFFAAALLATTVRGFSEADRRRLRSAFVAAATALAVYAIWQRLHGFDLALERLGAAAADDVEGLAVRERLAAGRAFATLATPAAWGVVVAMALPVAVVAARRAPHAGRRLAWGGAAGLLAVGGALSFSFTAVIAGLAGVVVAGARRPRGRRLLPWALPLGLIVVAAFAWVRGVEIWGTPEDPSPLRMRAGNVRIAGEMIADAPWLGVGPGAYGEVYAAYRRETDNATRHAHSLPAEWIAEAGIPLGVAASLAFLGWFVAPAFRRGGERSPESLAVTAAGVAFAAHNLLDFTAFLPATLWCAVALRATLSDAPRAARSHAPGVVTIVAAIAVAGVGISEAIGRHHEEAGARARSAGDHDRARERYRRAVGWAPWNLDAAVGRAAAAVERGDADADERLERVARRAPWRAAVATWQAGEAERRGDGVDAWLHWERAASLSPQLRSARERRDAYRRRWIEALR